jgi:hypothetical protein
MLRIRPALKLRIGSRAASEKGSTRVARAAAAAVAVAVVVVVTVPVPSAGIAASKERTEWAKAGLRRWWRGSFEKLDRGVRP